jgi:50S ribosomal protein L16 3-hydroxylase
VTTQGAAICIERSSHTHHVAHLRRSAGDNAAMDLHAPLALLGGLTPAKFMQRHWQRRPLLVRQAWPGVQAPLPRPELFALAARDDVEARLVRRHGAQWSVRHGPLARRSLPALMEPNWTLLVQGVDLHAEPAHRMLQTFRFVPAARLDDLMVSYASDGGGVGAHVDAYDVFLLQLEGRRRWRFGRAHDRRCVEGAPLKLLQRFEPSEECALEPGDMLYLPPLWGHEGVALGPCMTASIGFRSPGSVETARALMQGVADATSDENQAAALYVDAKGGATPTPARVPPPLQAFARAAWQRATRNPRMLERALGEWLSEPKAQVWFDGGARSPAFGARVLRLDRRTRMLYDTHHLFINGESFVATGRDAQCLRRLADARELTPADQRRLSKAARTIVQQWLSSGWIHEC